MGAALIKRSLSKISRQEIPTGENNCHLHKDFQGVETVGHLPQVLVFWFPLNSSMIQEESSLIITYRNKFWKWLSRVQSLRKSANVLAGFLLFPRSLAKSDFYYYSVLIFLMFLRDTSFHQAYYVLILFYGRANMWYFLQFCTPVAKRHKIVYACIHLPKFQL